MFIALARLKRSLSDLEKLHTFFGISFLAFKSLRLPIGELASVEIAREERRLLDLYYSPAPGFTGYYIPFRATGRHGRWVNSRYPDTTLQRIRTDTFRDVLIHERNTNNWGWRPEYVERLIDKLRGRRIPAVSLATWIYRAVDFATDISPAILASRLIADFTIDEAEHQLFDFTAPESVGDPDVALPASWRDLRPLLGSPPGMPPDIGGTLGHLSLRGVGPARAVDINPGARLNVITGDNGFGKSFLLECAWWALTREWVDSRPARPAGDDVSEARITYTVGTDEIGETISSAYDWSRQAWSESTERSVLPGLVLFARADGSFAVWDPARQLDNGSDREFVQLSRDETWNGKQVDIDGQTVSLSEGLLRDWITWRHDTDTAKFDVLKQVLARLSPPEFDPPLRPGDPTMIPGDVRTIPTITHPYGDVPVTYASAGIARIVSLAYLLVWSWHTHVRFSRLARRDPQDRLIVFIDEVEAHLHPKWQRTIVPALLDAIRVLRKDVRVQMFIATHAPLVLASMELEFNEDSDKLFHMDLLDHKNVQLAEVTFAKYGDVDNWLRSELFGLKHARSIEGERAIERAKRLQRTKKPTSTEVIAAHEELERVLGAHDEFWPRWRFFATTHGVDS